MNEHKNNLNVYNLIMKGEIKIQVSPDAALPAVNEITNRKKMNKTEKVISNLERNFPKFKMAINGRQLSVSALSPRLISDIRISELHHFSTHTLRVA